MHAQRGSVSEATQRLTLPHAVSIRSTASVHLAVCTHFETKRHLARKRRGLSLSCVHAPRDQPTTELIPSTLSHCARALFPFSLRLDAITGAGLRKDFTWIWVPHHTPHPTTRKTSILHAHCSRTSKARMVESTLRPEGRP